jgi:predicted short-subunit dehydrogenase-like oxidoreductase (DUF2520 family)
MDEGLGRTVAVIGAGKVGGAIGRLLAGAGYRIAAVAARTPASAARAAAFIGSGVPTTDPAAAASGADIVLVTTPDRAIRPVCEALARGGGLRPGALVAHCSGAHGLDLLDAARDAGALRAVLHPLQSVPGMEEGVANIPGSSFRVEADAPALAVARELVRALGGVELALPGWTGDPASAALYHAGAVAVSNYLVALLDYGLEFFGALGADREAALRAVLPLAQGTLRNVGRLGIPGALTGPIARGDAGTVAGHLAAMRERAPELLPLYRELALRTIALAAGRGALAEDAAEELRRLVRE